MLIFIDASPSKLDSRNSSDGRGNSFILKTKISNQSKLLKRSTLKVKKSIRKPSLVNRTAKKRVLTVNKALNKQFNTHRRNKDKFLLPPIHNGRRLTDTNDSKSSASGHHSEGIKMKSTTRKMNSIPLESSGFIRHKSPIKIPVSKRLSDPFELGKKNYVKKFDFSVKKA